MKYDGEFMYFVIYLCMTFCIFSTHPSDAFLQEYYIVQIDPEFYIFNCDKKIAYSLQKSTYMFVHIEFCLEININFS